MFFKKEIAKRTKASEGKIITRPVNAAASKKVPSIFGSDMIVSGDIYSDGELHIDGKVEGNIKCRSVVLGLTADVKGNITADTVKVFGRFNGKVIAKNVVLASSAYITGEITHESLEIEVGAYLEGACHRSDEPMPAKQSAPDLMISDLREPDFHVTSDDILKENKKK